MARLVRERSDRRTTESAADHWLALVSEVPEAVVEVPVLMRLLPVLRGRMAAARGEAEQKRARERLIDALRRCVDPSSGALTPAWRCGWSRKRGGSTPTSRGARRRPRSRRRISTRPSAPGSSSCCRRSRAAPGPSRLPRRPRHRHRQRHRQGSAPSRAPHRHRHWQRPSIRPGTGRRAAPLPEDAVQAAAARIAARMPPTGALRVSEVIPVELGEEG